MTFALGHKDIVLLYPGPQGGAFQAEDLGGAALTADLPVGLIQDLGDIAAFYLLQSLKMSGRHSRG